MRPGEESINRIVSSLKSSGREALIPTVLEEINASIEASAALFKKFETDVEEIYAASSKRLEEIMVGE